MDLSVKLPGLDMKNPIMPASGCFGFGQEASEFYDLSILGALVTKSITLTERKGNPSPRVCETPSGMLNAIGLQNHGLDHICAHELRFMEGFGLPVLANVAGQDIEEYVQVVKGLNQDQAVTAYELNVSCPNVKHGGMGLGTQPETVAQVIQAVKAVATKPVYVKLSPNVTDIQAIARACAQADGIVAINTLVGMRFNLRTGKPILANGTGGLSGPAILPIALRMVHQIRQVTDQPIIGVGGISCAQDVLEFLLAGANAVQIGAASFANPTLLKEIIEALPKVLHDYGYVSVKEINR